MKTFAQLKEQYLRELGQLPPLGSMGKCAKRRRARNRAVRFASCSARRDLHVYHSSHGMFHSVADLQTNTRRREAA